MTQRIEPFFLDNDAKIDPSLLNFDTNQKIEPSFQTWLKELNIILELCLKELNFFFETKKNSEKWFFSKSIFRMTQIFPQRIEPFFNMTQRIEPFVWFKEYDSKDWTFLID